MCNVSGVFKSYVLLLPTGVEGSSGPFDVELLVFTHILVTEKLRNKIGGMRVFVLVPRYVSAAPNATAENNTSYHAILSQVIRCLDHIIEGPPPLLRFLLESCPGHPARDIP